MTARLRALKPQNETRTRILDAAEELFMLHGFGGTSMRLLTSRAGVNLAAVNYHFGSKDALIEAVFRRRLDPMNTERVAGDGRGREGRRTQFHPAAGTRLHRALEIDPRAHRRPLRPGDGALQGG